MNSYVVKKLLGDDFPPERAPNVLDEYANTGSAGSLIAFHKYNHLKTRTKRNNLLIWCWIFYLLNLVEKA